jgi:hypothetical protein
MSSSPGAYLYPIPLSQSRSLTQTGSRSPPPSSSKSSRHRLLHCLGKSIHCHPLRLAARPARCSLTLRSHIQDRPCSMFPVVEQGVIVVFEAASRCSSHFPFFSCCWRRGSVADEMASQPTHPLSTTYLATWRQVSTYRGPFWIRQQLGATVSQQPSWPPYKPLLGFLQRQSAHYFLPLGEFLRFV